ncbi:glycoside hydrolase family 5 protein [Verrucomicrobiota bacterium]
MPDQCAVKASKFMRLCIKITPALMILIVCALIMPDVVMATDAFDVVRAMGRGINLGNTMEPPDEGNWTGGVGAQEYYFDDYVAAGFTCVRIPVRWDNHTETNAPYTVDSIWMARVEEVVDWGLSRGLYIVLNTHHDHWIKEDQSPENIERFESIWTQISDHFQNKSEKLLFEIINEPYHSPVTNDLTDAELNALNTNILNIIRLNNPSRHVIITGNEYHFNTVNTIILPNDPYIIVTVHTYQPYSFCGNGIGTWGSASDRTSLESNFDMVETWSQNNNVPLFFGEFGVVTNADPVSRLAWYNYMVNAMVSRGYAFAFWDHPGNFETYNRDDGTWDTDVLDELIDTGVYPIFDDDADGLINYDEFNIYFTDPDDPDSDDDGMPDGWEVSYSLAPTNNDASDDADLDGLSNLGEYYGGTAADDSNSVFKIIQAQSIDEGLRLTWLGGTNGSTNAYMIYRATSLMDGDWSSITNYPRTNASGTNVWVDTDASNYWPNIFYKITAPTNQ